MNTKVKLISTISVFCMVLALLVTGVWAVSTANVTLGGTISFKADNVHATVTGTITGTQETITLPDIEYDAKTDTTSTAFQSNVEKWSNNQLTFTSENLITMTITVTNLSTERSLYVKVTDNTTTSNINKTFTNTANVESGKEYELIAEGSITYTMTMKVDKLDLSAEATYAYDVNLRDANYNVPDMEDLSMLSFMTIDAEQKNLLVSTTSNNIGDLMLPSRVLVKGEEYTITQIGDFANSGITNLTIPASVVIIQEGAFKDNPITSIVVDEKNSVYDSRDNCNAIIETATHKLISGCRNTIFPDSIKSIGVSAFERHMYVASAEIPYGVTEIGDYAFRECYSLASIILPETIQTIGKGAFDWYRVPCTVTVKATTPPTLASSGMFNDYDGTQDNLVGIYVPAESVSAYKEAEYWSDYADKIFSIEDL